jgi:hypothetical protein
LLLHRDARPRQPFVALLDRDARAAGADLLDLGEAERALLDVRQLVVGHGERREVRRQRGAGTRIT